MIWPVAKRGRPRQRHVPDILSILAEDMLAHVKWHTISWRTGTKESSRLALLLFACGSPTDHRSGLGTRVSNICPGSRLGSSAYYLANLPPKTDLPTLAATNKARWICDQAPHQLKEELVPDPFEGQSWQGLHRNALMRMIAYASPQYRRPKTPRGKKKNQRATASTD